MGIVSTTQWCLRMDAAVAAKDRDAIIALVDETIAYEEHRNRGERRIGRWWHALFGGKLDVNDLEDHQLTSAQLQERTTARQQIRERMIQSWLKDIE